MVTLKDIARIANVNVSTVSKALRNNTDLNKMTVLRIRKIADQLNYVYECIQDEVKRIPVVGVICPELSSQYYTDILNSFQSNLRAAGYHTIIMVSNFSYEQEMSCIDMLLKNSVSGIVCFTENEENQQELKEILETNDITFLLVSTVENYNHCDSICIDDRQSVMLAVNHLAEIGHKKIAYIGDALSEPRKNTFIAALQNKSIEVCKEFIIQNEFRFEECGYMGMKKLLELKNKPTGLFAAYDNIAIGAMRTLYESNYKIPDDFSVASIDNIKTSSYLYKSLTTVTEPTTDLGELASGLLIDKIKNNKKTIQHIKLKPTLNIRETTSYPRKES